ncbi:MAG: hypothetical protein V4733_03880 [Verrucomicrobiota bacterium]
MKHLLAPLAVCLSLCNCSLFTAGTADGIDANPFTVLETQSSGWKAKSPKRVSVGILRSRKLDNRWGSPDLLVGPDGSYALNYKNPGNPRIGMVIYGSPQMFLPAGITPPTYTEIIKDRKGKIHAREVSQSWREAEIAGQTVKYCVSEETDGPRPNNFVTETFRMKDKKGRVGSYRVRISAGKEGSRLDAKHLLETIRF